MQERNALILHSDEIGWAAVQVALQERGDVEVVGHTRRPDVALRVAATHPIDLLLASSRISGVSSEPTLAALRASSCQNALIALFVYEATLDELGRFGQLGLAACCSWDELHTAETIQAILAAMLTGSLLVSTRQTTCSFVNACCSTNGVHHAVDLSALDSRILKFLADGFTAQEIARHVCRATHTIENRLLALRIKFEARNSAQLVHIAHRLSLIHRSDDDNSPNETHRQPLVQSVHDQEILPD